MRSTEIYYYPHIAENRDDVAEARFELLVDGKNEEGLAIGEQSSWHVCRLLRVYSIKSVVDVDVCKRLIEIAEEVGFQKSKHEAANTVRQVSVRDKLDDFGPIVNMIYNEIVVPFVTRAYGAKCIAWPSHSSKMKNALRLICNDMFVSKYTHGDGFAGIEYHRDAEDFAWVLQLNERENFSSGGTTYRNVYSGNKRLTTRLECGDMSFHPGFISHKGTSINSGTRYILAGFLKVHADVDGLIRSPLSLRSKKENDLIDGSTPTASRSANDEIYIAQCILTGDKISEDP
jgi:hypothetical protein